MIHYLARLVDYGPAWDVAILAGIAALTIRAARKAHSDA